MSDVASGVNKYITCEFLFQIGGNDQMGNMHTGYWLISKLRNVTATGKCTSGV